MKKELIIFGSAEIASLAKFYFENDSEYTVAGFTIDDAYVTSDKFEGLPIIPFSELVQSFSPHKYKMHVALSYNKLNALRQDKFYQVKKAGYELVSYVCSKSVYWNDLHIGENCFILENQTIQPTVKIGHNVMLWSGNHIGHGTEIKDHCYFASHVVISGHCTIGERCFLGVNATVRDFCNIGDDCFIGMDASVTKHVPSGSVVLGHAATILPPDDRIAKSVKKNYLNIEA